MGILLELVRQVSILLYPFMPQTSEKIWRQLCVEKKHKEQYSEKIKIWRAVSIPQIKREGALFPPLESKA